MISGTIPYIEKYFSLTPEKLGTAVSSALFGCIVGACVSGALSDRYGRKRVMIAAALLFTISAVFTAVTNVLWMFIAARLIGGFAIGLSSPVAPMYIAEIAPEKNRGALVTLNQLAITFGILVAYFCDWGIAGLGSEQWGVVLGWRWMFASEIPPAVLCLVALLFVPESPRWLAKEGRWAQAGRILARIGGRQHAEQEMREIRDALDREETSLKQLFRPGFRKALLIGVAIMIFSQITGNFAIFTYTPKLLMQLGFQDTRVALLGMVMVGAVNFLATIVAICFIDRLGRRPLLIFASLGMCLCMTILSWNSQHEILPPIVLLGWILGFVVCYAVGVGPGSWLVVSEIFPTRARGRAVSFCTVCLWGVNFLTTLAFPVFWEYSKAGTFWLFAFTSASMVVFVLAILPETKGLSLEAIQRMWRDSGMKPSKKGHEDDLS